MAHIKHHRLSMSSWNVLAICPHFQPNHKPNPEAAEGTLAHGDVESIFKQASSAEDAMDDRFKFRLKYPQSQWCAAEWHKLKSGADIVGAESFKIACAVEAKLEIRETDPLLDGIYGFADFVRIVRNRDNSLVRITVGDFKTFSSGKQCYDEQLAGYAVAVASTIPDATDDIPVDLYTAHGAVQRLTLTSSTLGECRRIAFDVITKSISREHFPQVANKHCKYCKNCPCEGAMAEVRAVVPTFPTLDISEKALKANPKKVPAILAAIDDAYRLLDTARENAREVVKTYGLLSINRDGLSVWTLGDDQCAYAVKTQCGRKEIAKGVDNSQIVELFGEGGASVFIAAAKISVKDLVRNYAFAETERTGETVDEKEATAALINKGVLQFGKAIEKLERVK